MKSVRGPAASSFTLGLISIFAGLIAGIPAIIMGFIAKKRGKASHEKSTLATVGITLGVLFTVINILVVAILAVAANKAYDKAQNKADQVRVDLNAAKMSPLYVGGHCQRCEEWSDRRTGTDRRNRRRRRSEQGRADAGGCRRGEPGQPIQVALSNSHGCVTFALCRRRTFRKSRQLRQIWCAAPMAPPPRPSLGPPRCAADLDDPGVVPQSGCGPLPPSLSAGSGRYYPLATGRSWYVLTVFATSTSASSRTLSSSTNTALPSATARSPSRRAPPAPGAPQA